jgi:hypothetical protein
MEQNTRKDQEMFHKSCLIIINDNSKKIFIRSYYIILSKRKSMTTIDNILSLLKDGKWHNREEITEKIGLSETKTELALNFLREYNFIRFSNDIKKAKLEPSTQRFILELLTFEQEETLDH